MSATSSIPKGLALAALLFGLGLTPALAFHDGGVARCSGCHVTHNSVDGLPVTPTASDHQLIAGSPSDVCLSCHATSQGAVLGTNPLTPPPEKGAGNFVFLLEDNLNDAASGSTSPIPGERGGHNLVAPGHGLIADTTHSIAPGGTFPANQLGCTSCHDPHGRSGFRMLHGVGELQGGLFSFSAPAPEGDGISLSAGIDEQPNRHAAYRSGMTAWCGNCHGRHHELVGTGFTHPIDDPLGIAERNQYDQYDGLTNPTGGNASTAYLPEVPFEDPGAGASSTVGPTASSRLSCLSCHRAHATSAPSAGRWDFSIATLGDDGVESGSWPIPNPYGDPSQPALCWKCHAGGAP